MAVQFLLDENVEHGVLRRLEERDQRVEHVEFHPRLGKGTDDTSLAEFSAENEWVIITYDPDFVKDHDPADYFGVVYFEDATLSAKQVAQIIHSMATHYPQSAFEGLEFGSPEWL